MFPMMAYPRSQSLGRKLELGGDVPLRDEPDGLGITRYQMKVVQESCSSIASGFFEL